MEQTLAIARLAIRQAFRSRVVLSLSALLLLAVFLLPVTIEGDGTLEGDLHVRLFYPLTAIRLILAVAILWASASAISSEIEDRRLLLVVCKPVRRVQIWLGKWLGLLTINALLLAVSGGIMIAMMLFQFHRAPLSDNQRNRLTHEYLAAREPIPPETADLDRQVREQVDQRLEQGGLPPEVTRDQLEEAARRTLSLERRTVPPGKSRTWTFRVDVRAPGQPLVIRYKLASSALGPAPLPGSWHLSWGGKERYTGSSTNVPGRRASFMTDAPAESGPHTLQLTYYNRSADDTKAIFPRDDGPFVMNYRSGFLLNAAKGLSLVFFQLAFLAAIGLTAGTLFSLPVAVLVAAYGLVMLRMRSYIARMAETGIDLAGMQHHHGPGAPEGSALEAILSAGLTALFRALHLFLAPLDSPALADALARGEWLSARAVAQSGSVRLILYAGILAALGAWLFNRRELGTAGETS